MNATNLFLKTDEHFRNSESFWSSLFAIQLVQAAKDNALKIPIRKYREEAGSWYFDSNNESLKIKKGFKFKDVVVEGKLRSNFIRNHRCPGIIANNISIL